MPTKHFPGCRRRIGVNTKAHSWMPKKSGVESQAYIPGCVPEACDQYPLATCGGVSRPQDGSSTGCSHMDAEDEWLM